MNYLYINGVFMLNSLILVKGFYVLIDYLLTHNSKEYLKVNHDKQMYITKNVSKSVILCYIGTASLIDLYYNGFSRIFVYKYSNLYVSNDIYALLFINKLPRTTICHHMTTILLLCINYFIDYENIGSVSSHIGMLLMGYTYFSSYSFLVNLYLGLRYIITDKWYKNMLRKIALNNYRICLYANWVSQIFFIVMTVSNHQLLLYYYIIYMILLIPIVNDDLVLIGWLSK